MSIHLWEAVAEPTERFSSCHCSVVLELDNRDLLVGYYAGAGEARPDAAWVLARRPPGAEAFGRTIEEEQGHVPRCKPVRLRSGDIIFGTEFKDGHSRLWTSVDEGETWDLVGSIPGEPNQHPSLIERSDGSILGLLRPSGRQACVLQAVSSDGGRTWSPAERTELPAPFAALDAVKLSDGRVALAWNRNPEQRNPLALALSEDEGRTWHHIRDLVTGEGQFHYPALIQSDDGLLHLTFTNNRRTIDHIVLTPEWIAGEGPHLPPWHNDRMERGLS